MILRGSVHKLPNSLFKSKLLIVRSIFVFPLKLYSAPRMLSFSYGITWQPPVVTPEMGVGRYRNLATHGNMRKYTDRIFLIVALAFIAST